MFDPDMLTQNVADLQAYNGLAQGAPPSQELGKEEFLKMLITQLRYQDPMDPMKDQAFIAQMAQFSSLPCYTLPSSALGPGPMSWRS